MQVVVAWSGGKDASVMLQTLIEREDCEVVELLTTAVDGGRTTMHRVRRELMERQAAALGYPIRFVDLEAGTGNDGYQRAMSDLFDDYERRGVDRVAYGDLYLEDVRAYRESRHDGRPIHGLWPLWGTDPSEIARRVRTDFEATVVCVDGAHLDESFVGRRYDEQFLADLPDEIDPAGENGEFHTFVHDGPPFAVPVAVEVGERYTREREMDGETVTLHYCDLVATEEMEPTGG